jgi:hypothetical protein
VPITAKKIRIDQVEGIVPAIAAGPEIEMMIAITVAEVAIEIIEAGEMTPATGFGDGQMILLT